MKQVAKLILVDRSSKYLMLYRSSHPSFPGDPDLPGGTIKKDEEPILAVIREVHEETGVTVNRGTIKKLYESSAYDKGYTYYLYKSKCKRKLDVTISWEHSRYEWLELNDFITEAHTAADKYMHMVYDYLAKNSS